MKRWVEVASTQTTNGTIWEEQDFQEQVMDFDVNPFSMEEKLVLAHETREDPIPYLEQKDINEVVEQALAALPFGFEEEEISLLYDAMYEAVVNALERVKI